MNSRYIILVLYQIKKLLYNITGVILQNGYPAFIMGFSMYVLCTHTHSVALKCYYRPTASLQLNNKRNTKYNITVT